MPPGKVSEFYRVDCDWFCNAALPSDIIVIVNGVNFHLHKFPLISKCGFFVKTLEHSQTIEDGSFCTVTLEEFPGGPDAFLLVSKFCYSIRINLTPRNIVSLYCAAEFLEMTNEYGEHNLLSKSESFFHRTVLRSWKDCILALQSCETLMSTSERLQLVTKSLNSLSMMACTDPSLFGWPIMMYGTFQSPGGGILWNGINTGTRISGSENDWWFEDISYLNVFLFEELIKTMQKRGIRPEKIAGAIMFYCRKYLPGLGRWHEGRRRTGTPVSFTLKPATVNQRILLETIVKILPEKKGKLFCRFLLGLLRVALILEVNHNCGAILETKIGMQLELATIDSLLIPNYSDSDTLYNTDCVERIVRCFLFSNPSIQQEHDGALLSLRSVAKLIDNYISEIASDVNLKPAEIYSLAVALPECSRTCHEGLYRSLDVFFKAHPWLSGKEKEHLCGVINYRKLSINACAHASRNDRLPLRVILRALFFEQLHLRMALAGPAGSRYVPSRRDRWVRVVRENRGLRTDMEKMGSRVGELEEEFRRMKGEVTRANKSRLGSPQWRLGCDLGRTRAIHGVPDAVESSDRTPRASI